MTRPYAIWPLRFSRNAPAMIDFYSRIGLHKALSHDNGTFATFDGRGGALGVHDANHTASGEVPTHTALNLTTDHLATAADELSTRGYHVKVWDETYGKQGVVAGPGGRVIGLNETNQQDLYGGYQVHDVDNAPSLDVVAVCVTPDLRAEAAFFAPFGFSAPSYDDPWWIGLRAGERSGVLGIHAGEIETDTQRPDDDLFGPPYLVRIGFETHDPLSVEAERLRAAGLEALLITESAAPHIELIDPDGERLEIHPAPPEVSS